MASIQFCNEQQLALRPVLGSCIPHTDECVICCLFGIPFCSNTQLSTHINLHQTWLSLLSPKWCKSTGFSNVGIWTRMKLLLGKLLSICNQWDLVCSCLVPLHHSHHIQVGWLYPVVLFRLYLPQKGTDDAMTSLLPSEPYELMCADEVEIVGHLPTTSSKRKGFLACSD